MKKKIKLMPDYNCSPLWDMAKGVEINIDKLPLSSQTKKRLNKWSETYNQILNLEDPISSGFKSENDEKDFEIEGKNLWLTLQKELCQDYQVFYFSQQESKLLVPDS
jgi:hypothetical protein